MRPLEEGIIYGPVLSRRFGWDLGVNLLSDKRKVCTFNCIYCQYGYTVSAPLMGRWELPTCEQVMDQWVRHLQSLKQWDIHVRHTTISGNGEPTLHPDFPRIVREMIEWRNSHMPQMEIAVLTNGSQIGDSSIREALAQVDQPVVKMDSALDSKIREIDRPLDSYRLDQLLEHLKKMNRVIIQTMFLKDWNDSPADLVKWRDAIRQAHPKEVQIYSLARSAPKAGLKPVSNDWLVEIAKESSAILKIPVHAFLTNTTSFGQSPIT